ncbi:MAG: isopeptide-forming domain-containing fimbrial protein [Solirubrobacterales bacterium]
MTTGNQKTRGILIALALLLGALMMFGPARAEAAGYPNISMSKTTSGSVLLGGNSNVTLTASNPNGQPTGYNLSFRDVLPPGISYVPGSSPSSTGEPQVIANAPAAGQTTLIWSNVADLTPNSTFTFTFQVTNSPAVFDIGDTYQNTAGSYLNCDPRYVPKFNAQGQPTQSGGNATCSGLPQETSYTGSATASANTLIKAIEIDKSEPSPEGQLLRGLHDHQTVYTLTVTNNEVDADDNVKVEDYLPAGLEFLGCGTQDNTTDAPTNPGSAEEYPGSGAINPGNAPAAPDCVVPDTVETVLNPSGLPAGVYTHVVWNNLGNLGPSGQLRIQYVAAVPIRQNTMTWTNGVPPVTGTQGSNLDNNSGPETTHLQGLTNHAKVTSDHQGPGGPTEVTDSEDHTVQAVDIRIVKSVTPAGLAVGQISTWSLAIATSEYRYFEDVEVSDTLGDGYCPLGPVNYEHTPPPATAECNPTGNNPSVPYTSAVEQTNGTWQITWDSSTAPALGTINPNSNLTISFPTKTREYFQQNYVNSTPVLSNDTGRNDVDIAGAAWVICAPGAPSPCPNLSPDKIDTDFTDGTVLDDDSDATQVGSGPSINKQVSPTVNGNCGSLNDYASGITPVASPGDTICWRLTMSFPNNLTTSNVFVGDYIPPGTTYVFNSTVALPSNTVGIFTGSPPQPDLFGTSGLRWALNDGGGEVQPGKVFDVVFATKVQRSTDSVDGDIEGNLMKAVYTNSDGTSFPLRDEEDFERSQPEISLLKGVYKVNGQPPAGNPPNVDGAVVDGGDDVTYRVDVTNDGSVNAINTQVWDILPPQVTCADVDAGSISNGGTCNAGQNRIEWSGLTVPATGNLTLTYTVEIPDGLSGGDVLNNTAGVREFASSSGSGPYVQVPENNIDPTLDPNANAPAAKDPSNVVIESSTTVKTRVTDINQPGNSPTTQATIGERINYTVTATIPQGTRLYGPTALVDNVSSRMTVVPLSASATLDNGTGGGPVPLPTAGLTLTQTGNVVKVDFPNPYSNPEHSGDDVIVLTFGAIVRDVYPTNYAQGNSTQYTMPNTGTLSWKDTNGTNRSASGSVNTTIVEPRISIDKTVDDDGPVSPNDLLNYTIQVSNGSAARVSTANNTVLTDKVPVGLTPANGGVPVADGGTVNPDGGIWNLATRTITWPTIPTINPGAITNITYQARVDNPAVGSDLLINHAQAATTSMPGTPTVERDSSTAAPGYLVSDEVPVEVSSPAIVKTGLPAQATIGQHVTVTVFASIAANLTNYDGTVEDDLPNGLIFDNYVSEECIEGCSGPVTISTLGVVPNGTGQRIGWWIGDVPAAPDSRVVALTYRAHVADQYQVPPGGPVLDGDALVNTATLLYNLTDKVTVPPTSPPDPSTFDRSLDDDHTTTVVEPDLALDKSVSGDDDQDDSRTTQPGDSYTFSIKVTNNGTSPAYDLTVTDQPDPALTNIQVNHSPVFEVPVLPVNSNDPIQWFIPGPIDPGESVTLTYTADLVPSAQLHNMQQVVNTAELPSYWGVSAGEREDPDNAGIDYREYEGNNDTVTMTVLVPTVTLDKTTGLPQFPDTGDAQTETPFPWRILITNPNTGSSLLGVDLTDTLPPNWTYVPNSAQITGTGTLTPGGQVNPTITQNPTGDVLVWSNIANLVGVQNAVVSFNAIPEPEAAIDPGLTNPHVNEAEAIGEDTSGATASGDGPYTDDDDATATLETPVTDIQIVKTADDPAPTAGTNTTWTLVVKNNGPKVSPDVEVSDVLPAGLTYVSATSSQGTCAENPAGTMHCQIGQMNVDDEVTIHLTTAVGAGTVGQTLTNPADVDDPYIDDSNPANNHSEDDVIPTESADVGIGKSIDEPLFAGQTGSYKLTVTNHGPSVARGVTVTDTLPENLTYAGATTPVGSCSGSGQDFSCDLGDLDPGQTVVIDVSVNVLEGGEYTNCADVASPTPDPDGDNNHSCTTNPAENTDLAIEKTGPPYFPEGKNRNYTLLVTNVGDQPTGGTTTVTDRIPDVLRPEAAYGNGWSCAISGQKVTCTRSDVLEPGDSFPLITIRVVARENLLFRPIGNTGHVHLPGDPNPDNDQDTVRTKKGAICEGGSLALNPAFVWVGQKTIVKATLRTRAGAPAIGLPVRIKGNGKGGASGKLRILTTNGKGKVHFTARATSTEARWTVSVPQCHQKAVLAPKRQETCRAMNVTPRTIDINKTTVLTVRLRTPEGRPAIGITVVARGQGTGDSARTNGKGMARLRVRPNGQGYLVVTAPNATRCRFRIGASDLDAAGAGNQLTG